MEEEGEEQENEQDDRRVSGQQEEEGRIAENSQGTLTLTTRKTDHKNKQAKLWLNPHRPRVIECTRDFPHASVHCACCWAFRSALRVTN